jgi:hypothetical protein
MNIKTDYRKQHKSYGIKTQYSVDSFNKQIIDLLNNDSASNGDFCWLSIFLVIMAIIVDLLTPSV